MQVIVCLLLAGAVLGGFWAKEAAGRARAHVSGHEGG
jgi:hypothetical protein